MTNELMYDAVVIGDGPAGDAAARKMGSAGLRVALVEAAELGGECLNSGCVPSKALLALTSRERLGWSEAMARVRAVQALTRGSDPDGGFSEAGVDLYRGAARFLAPKEIAVGDSVLRASHVVIATGTAPAIPSIPGLAEANPLTNRTVFSIPSLPRRLAVIGGGAIGAELGQAFRRLGAEVTIFEALDRIVATEEPEVSAELERILLTQGVRVETRARIERAAREEDGCVSLWSEGRRWEFDEVLVAAGRRAQLPEGLDLLGLERDERGFIKASACGETNIPGVWAAGDVTGGLQFTHYASAQGHHVARHIIAGECEPRPAPVAVWAIFTEPEVGHVGLTEAEARSSGRPVRAARLDARELDWFRAGGSTNGFAKVVADAATGQLLGAHFVCERASDLAGEAALAIQCGLAAQEVAAAVHPYPTAAELFRWACARVSQL